MRLCDAYGGTTRFWNRAGALRTNAASGEMGSERGMKFNILNLRFKESREFRRKDLGSGSLAGRFVAGKWAQKDSRF